MLWHNFYNHQDLLALYLSQGRQLPTNYDSIIIDDNLWEGLRNSIEYKHKKSSDEISYVWDRLIELLCKDILNGNMEFGNSLEYSEMAIRSMAHEDRFSRRNLSKSFLEFMELATQKKVRSRYVKSPSGVFYVFLACPHGEDRKFRVAELGNRCFVVRGLNPESKTVVGIATERYEQGQGFSLDIIFFYKDAWTEDDQSHLENMQKELGYFVSPVLTKIKENEYPSVSGK